MTARYSWDDASTWHADPDAAEDDLAEDGETWKHVPMPEGVSA